MSPPPATAVARILVDGLEAAGIPYAVGGALALAAWGFPRATTDVDLDVFIEPEAVDPVLDTLERSGCTFDRAAAQRAAEANKQFVVHYQGMRIDEFPPSIPLYQSTRSRFRRASLEERPAWFISPEDLAVFEMVFFRGKDLIDLERLPRFCGSDLDREYVRRWLVEIVGADDARLPRWRQLVEDVDAAPPYSDVE